MLRRVGRVLFQIRQPFAVVDHLGTIYPNDEKRRAASALIPGWSPVNRRSGFSKFSSSVEVKPALLMPQERN